MKSVVLKAALVAVFLLLGFAVYSQVVFRGGFVFDDFDYIVRNPQIRDMSAAGISDSRQIGYLSFACNYALGKNDPMAYHLVNVIIHVVNSLLALSLGLTVAGLSGKPGEPPGIYRNAAFLAALIFLVHPIQTMAVSYITQRFTSLATFFYFSAVLFYLKSRVRLRDGASTVSTYSMFILSILCALSAMRTKEISFTIPIMLALFEILFFMDRDSKGRSLVFLAPFLLSLCVIPLSIFGPSLGIIKAGSGIAEVTRLDKIKDLAVYPADQYYFTQTRVVSTYIFKLLFPVDLRVVYDFPISKSFLELPVIMSAIFLSALLSGAVLLWKKGGHRLEVGNEAAGYRITAVGLFWFFLALSVESLTPIKDVIFEHRVYLPSFGFFMSLSAGIMPLVDRIARGRFRLLTPVVPFVLIVLPLSVGTYLRNNIWMSELNLWSDVVKKTPGKAIGYNNRGAAYAKIGRYDLALEDFNRVVAMYDKARGERMKWENSDFSPSNMSKTYAARADVNALLGNRKSAEEDYRRSADLFTFRADVEDVLRIADDYAKKGAFKQAVAQYDMILNINPDHPDALNDRANAYSMMGRYDEAVRDLTKVVSIRPDFARAYYNRGIAYAWSKRNEKALADFRRACGMGFEPACAAVETVLGGKK